MVSTSKSLFDRLKKGLEECIAHEKGELTLRTLEVPEAPPSMDAKTILGLRQASRMSQAIFARVLNISTKTLQSWEQGTRVPSMAALRLLQIYAAHPEEVCKNAGLASFDGREVRLFCQKTSKPPAPAPSPASTARFKNKRYRRTESRQ